MLSLLLLRLHFLIDEKLMYSETPTLLFQLVATTTADRLKKVMRGRR